MTDSHEYTPHVEPVVETKPVVEEVDPMNFSLTDLVSKAKDALTFSKRIKLLEERLAHVEEQLAKATTERDSLQAENGNLKDQTRTLKDSLDYKTHMYENQQASTTTWMRKFDEEHASLLKAKEEAEHANDERDEAILTSNDWKRSHEAASTELANVTQTLREARESWFSQENDLTNTINTLSAERDRFRDRYDRCKSFAAQIMAMDQQH